mmetsp:Transcript_47759/g.120221  ORF Transcript_47759/g.120221 Transcript_47759/m.120221 type:complete len:373 (+) Transcript_47759:3271-4389(+)
MLLCVHRHRELEPRGRHDGYPQSLARAHQHGVGGVLQRADTGVKHFRLAEGGEGAIQAEERNPALAGNGVDPGHAVYQHLVVGAFLDASWRERDQHLIEDGGHKYEGCSLRHAVRCARAGLAGGRHGLLGLHSVATQLHGKLARDGEARHLVHHRAVLKGVRRWAHDNLWVPQFRARGEGRVVGRRGVRVHALPVDLCIAVHRVHDQAKPLAGILHQEAQVQRTTLLQLNHVSGGVKLQLLPIARAEVRRVLRAAWRVGCTSVPLGHSVAGRARGLRCAPQVGGAWVGLQEERVFPQVHVNVCDANIGVKHRCFLEEVLCRQAVALGHQAQQQGREHRQFPHCNHIHQPSWVWVWVHSFQLPCVRVCVSVCV